MFTKRSITAIFGILIAIFTINYYSWLFGGIILVISLCAWNEYHYIMQNKGIKVWYWGGLYLLFFLITCAWQGNISGLIFVITFANILILIKLIFYNKKFILIDAICTLFGLIYIGLCFSHILLLQNINSTMIISTMFGYFPVGTTYIWLTFVGTWASDTFAYFTGLIMGKHKLCLSISPGKTWEGTLGGIFGSITFVYFLGKIFYIPIIHIIFIGIIIGFMATLGDLAMSVLKRFCGVKDTGSILPGHGGILDRFDSILFVAPVIYYYVSIFL